MYTEELYQPEDTAFSGNLEVVHILPRFINDQDTIEGQVIGFISWIHHFCSPWDLAKQLAGNWGLVNDAKVLGAQSSRVEWR